MAYTCQIGYKHTDGDLTRTCQADGTLTGVSPVCTSKLLLVTIMTALKNDFFLHTGKGYLRFYPGIENLILPTLSYPGCHVKATCVGCSGTHAHGRQGMHSYVKVASS